MRTLVCVTALLAVVSAGHQAAPRAHSSGSHGNTYSYSLPSGHVRVNSYAKSHSYMPTKHHYAPAKHHHQPHTVTKYVHKPVVKIVEVPKVIVKHVPKYVVKEVPQIVYKEVPKVVVKEVEVPHVVYKHVPVTHEVKIATPVVQTVHAAAAIPALQAAPVPVQAYHAAVAPAPLPYQPAPVAGYQAAPVAVGAAYPYAGSVSSQFHAQDELGRYEYGYANPSSSKQELKSADGVTRGGFSYVDANGQTQVATYFSDATGFHIARTDLPVGPAAPANAELEAPEAVVETPEVAEARAAHLKAHAEALAASSADAEEH